MNDQEDERTNCGSEEVPAVEVIEVEIEEHFLSAIKEQILALRPEFGDTVMRIPLDMFMALPGNKVIQVVVKGGKTFVPGPDDTFEPQSLIPIAIFVGKGSQTTGTTVGPKTRYIDWGL